MIPFLEVYDSSTGSDVLVGRARFTLRHNAISTLFTYDESYLAHPLAYAIDPALPLQGGASHCVGIPGTFRDSSPDRWGRHLITRERENEAIENDVAFHRLDEVDFLVGVFDRTREGSLRFRKPDSPFLAEANPVPPLLRLPELLAASRAVAKNEAGQSQIKDLLDAGSGSLGGARPKASVRDENRLLLAKFSHPHDDWDVMAWEKTMLDMAHDVGIPVPPSKLVRIGNESILLLERFDREGSLVEGKRIPYMSAMTALQAEDGSSRDYAELSEEVVYRVDNAKEALIDLFTRLAFFLCVNNTDDHMRNWGFLRKDATWGLAPLFDVNPNPSGDIHRVTSILGVSGNEEASALWEFASYAGLTSEQARCIINSILDVTAHWKEYAAKNGCSERERMLFAPMFSQKRKALSA